MCRAARLVPQRHTLSPRLTVPPCLPRLPPPQGLESLLPGGGSGVRRTQSAAGPGRGRDENASPERSHSPFLLGGSNGGAAVAAAPRKAASEPATVAALGLPVPVPMFAGLHGGPPVVHPTSVEVGGGRSGGSGFDPW